MKNELISKLRYDPLSGNFWWGVSPRIGIRIGAIAGSIGSHGYAVIKFKGKTYRLHNLAWEMYYGTAPTSQIDHKNRLRSDNRISNLRLATDTQNKANRKVRSDSRTGMKGVVRSRTVGKWIARIRVDKTDRHIGTFSSAEEASIAYLSELKKLRGEFASV
jgi:hypothetical protein